MQQFLQVEHYHRLILNIMFFKEFLKEFLKRNFFGETFVFLQTRKAGLCKLRSYFFLEDHEHMKIVL